MWRTVGQKILLLFLLHKYFVSYLAYRCLAHAYLDSLVSLQTTDLKFLPQKDGRYPVPSQRNVVQMRFKIKTKENCGWTVSYAQNELVNMLALEGS